MFGSFITCIVALSVDGNLPTLSVPLESKRYQPDLQKLSYTKEPNPPKWSSSVRVFGPTDTDVEAVTGTAFKLNGGH